MIIDYDFDDNETYLEGFQQGFFAAMNYLHKEDFPDWKTFVPEERRDTFSISPIVSQEAEENPLVQENHRLSVKIAELEERLSRQL
jgi:hypothetical protein